jgi:hypothetical protein
LATYRIYHVGGGGRLRLGEAFQAADDAEAVAGARVRARGQAAELWQGGRLVGRFDKAGAFMPAG